MSLAQSKKRHSQALQRFIKRWRPKLRLVGVSKRRRMAAGEVLDQFDEDLQALLVSVSDWAIDEATSGKHRLKVRKVHRCRICGCTEKRACNGGCSWANKEKTICSACKDDRKSLKAWAGMDRKT